MPNGAEVIIVTSSAIITEHCTGEKQFWLGKENREKKAFLLILSLCLKQHKQLLLRTEQLNSCPVPHHCPLASAESRLSLTNRVSPLMPELGNGRRDQNHEKPQPWKRKSTEPPSADL